jgi:hypothetical protein
MEEDDFAPQSILTDFESGTIKSVQSLFPNVLHKGNILTFINIQAKIKSFTSGCLFHFGQCLWRQIQTLGLSKKYQEDKCFHLNVRKLMSLAFVPVVDVVKAFDVVVAKFDDDTDEFIDYFEKVWIGERKKRGTFSYRNKSAY